MTNAELVAHATKLLEMIESGQQAACQLAEIGDRLESVLRPHEGRVFKVRRCFEWRWFKVVNAKPVPFRMPARLWLASLDEGESEAGQDRIAARN